MKAPAMSRILAEKAIDRPGREGGRSGSGAKPSQAEFAMSMEPAVLFVCLGNICRSPLAEAAFRAEAARRDLRATADSAGTGAWHVGEPPDPRACAIARANGIDIGALRGRQVAPDDFHRFTHMIALDRSVLRALQRIRPHDARASLSLMLDHASGRAGEDVADPYYGDEGGFATTWADVSAGAEGLVEALLRSR